MAIGTLNTKRKERLLLLLEYIEDQGEPMNNRVKYGTRVIGAPPPQTQQLTHKRLRLYESHIFELRIKTWMKVILAEMCTT